MFVSKGKMSYKSTCLSLTAAAILQTHIAYSIPCEGTLVFLTDSVPTCSDPNNYYYDTSDSSYKKCYSDAQCTLPAAETCTGDEPTTTSTLDCSSKSIVSHTCLSNGDCFNLSPTKDNKSCVGTYCKPAGSQPSAQSTSDIDYSADASSSTHTPDFSDESNSTNSSTNNDGEPTDGSESNTSSSSTKVIVPDSGGVGSNETPDWLSSYDTSDSKTGSNSGKTTPSGTSSSGKSNSGRTTDSNGTSSPDESKVTVTKTSTKPTGSSSTTSVTKTTSGKSNSTNKSGSNKSKGSSKSSGKKSTGSKKSAGGSKSSHNVNTSVGGR